MVARVFMTKNNHDFLLLLLLLITNQVSYFLIKKIIGLFSSIEELYSNLSRPGNLEFTTEELSIIKLLNQDLLTNSLSWVEKETNRYLITVFDDYYPKLLQEIHRPPLLLFAVGSPKLLATPQLAIVGSRNPTLAGKKIAKLFAQELTQYGFTVTSGFATGIDKAAHEGAIEASGRTVAVLGSGLNHLYPAVNSTLAEKIVDHGGLVVSEFPLEERAKAWHFPQRNRIISGLSLGVLVVEAAMKSGSLVTARLAVEQNREVFAVPGSIFNAVSKGPNYLIKQGVKLVEGIQDIIEELPGSVEFSLEPLAFSKAEKLDKNKLDCPHSKLLDCVGFEVVTVDELVVESGFSVSRVQEILADLELKQLIVATEGGYIKI